MAPVVASFTVNRKSVWGDRRVVSATVAFDTGDYAAGGVAVTAANFGLQVIEEMICHIGPEVSGTPTANLYEYLPATGKIRVFQCGADNGPLKEKGTEAFGAGASVRVLVIGY